MADIEALPLDIATLVYDELTHQDQLFLQMKYGAEKFTPQAIWSEKHDNLAFRTYQSRPKISVQVLIAMDQMRDYEIERAVKAQTFLDEYKL